jgi:hypothetical protein
MGLVWWLMRALGPCLVVNGGVGSCLVVNGVWAVFSIWVVAQLMTVNGSVELGFLPPQPHDSTPKPLPPQIQSPDLTKLSPLLPPSLSAAAFPCCRRRLGALPCSLCGSDFPRCCCCAFLCSRRRHLPVQPLLLLAPSCSRRRLTTRSTDAWDAAATP